jgi:hypothetical protein
MIQKTLYIILILLTGLSLSCLAQVEKISYRGWSNCYRIHNDLTEVIIHPETGGRVMAYRIAGKNILYEDSLQNGKTFDHWKKEKFDPDGGRLDYGPEQVTQKIHSLTWMGPWKAEIPGPATLVLTSPRDEELGLMSQRIFTLSPDGTKLEISQTAENITNDTITRHFWSRTLVKPGGIMTLPVDRDSSRYPAGYGQFEWGPNRINTHPEHDDRIWIKGNVLHFHAVGNTIKAGTDGMQGWMAYQWDNIIFLKRYRTYKAGLYTGSENMTGIFFSNGRFAEMEPCSPTYHLAPGEVITFSETWQLIPL